MSTDQKYAITVRNACFGYDQYNNNNLVLNEVNLNVAKGEIYGLLGASGCGKTTLLKIIIGLLEPKSGEVSVFGYKPGTRESGTPGIGVGYMPQEISLPTLFTVNEVFQYFGRIYLLDKGFIDKQIMYFLSAFGLNNPNQTISNLSGGQQRRVSLAIALFSYPRFLILDEPTVGVDPLLQQRIWSLLRRLVEERNTTIIVTTHYIEEMRSAKTVAFLRNGKILAEESPDKILKASGCLHLEEAFLNLCMQQQISKETTKWSLGSQFDESLVSKAFIPRKGLKSVIEPLNDERRMSLFHQNLNIFTAVVWKISKTYTRHTGPLFSFSLPIIAIILILFAIGPPPKNMNLGWVVDDKLLTSANNATADGTPFLPELLLSCLQNSKMFKVVKYNSANDAIADAKKLNIVGFIHLKKNFSEAFYERDLFLNSDIDNISNDTLDAGIVHLSMDVTVKPLFDLFKHELFKIVQTFREKSYELIGVNSNASLFPLQLGELIIPSPERENYSLYTHQTVVAVIATAYNAYSVTAIAITLLMDIKEETNSRLLSAGVKPYHLLVGAIFTKFILMSVSFMITFSLLIFVFSVPFQGSFILAIINILLVILSGSCLGAAIAGTIRTEFNCLLFIYAIFINQIIVSDAIWPTIAAPYFMKLLLPFTPAHFQTLAMIKLFNYSACNFFSDILPAFGSSFCYIVIFSVIACFVLQKGN